VARRYVQVYTRGELRQLQGVTAGRTHVLHDVEFVLRKAGLVKHVSRLAVNDNVTQRELFETQATVGAFDRRTAQPVRLLLALLLALLLLVVSALAVVLHGAYNGHIAEVVVQLRRLGVFVALAKLTIEEHPETKDADQVQHQAVAPADDDQG